MSQAVAAPIMGDMILASGKSADCASTSRRAVLAALAVIPATAAVSAVPVHSLADSWTLALRDYRAADAAYINYLANVWNPLQEELERLTPRPPYKIRVERERGGPVEVAHSSAKPDRWMWEPTPEGRAAGKELSERWAAWHVEYERHAARLGQAAAEEEENRLYDRFQEAEERLMLTPAPDVAAVLVKIDLMCADPHRDRQIENERFIKRDLQYLAALAPAGTLLA